MAKLLIFRGETKVQEHELKEQTVRIGRGAQNDVVLEDPGKGVSRHHAEIRFEGGRYTLLDLQSQNGIWVSGTRVPSVVLEPGVTAALGPFRLMMQAPAPVSSIVAVPAIPADPATELTQLSSRTAAPLDLDSLSRPSEKAALPKPAETLSSKPAEKAPEVKPIVEKVPAVPAQKPPPVQKATPPPVQKSPAPKPATQQRAWYTDARVLGTVAALLVIGLSAVIGYKFMRNGTSPAWDPTAAQQLIAGGKCQEALDTQINPALQKNPNDARALMLRDQCNKQPPPTLATSTIPATPPVADNVADRLNEAEALLAGNVAADCHKALDTVNAVLAEDSNNERANDLKTRANACINPIKPSGPPPVTAEKPATPLPPSKGGLEVIQGETEKAYKARMDAAKKKYDDAVDLLNSQKYSQALTLLTELMNEVPSGYLDLQQRRDDARAGMRNDAKVALASAESAQSRGELDTAWEQIRRARQLDPPNPQIESAYQRIVNARLELGRKKCSDGKVAFSLNDSATAIPALQEAVKLLQGTNDPCYATARDYLQKLMGK